jgi:hypothetical protein
MDTKAKAAELSAMNMRQLQTVIRTEGFDIVVNKSKTKAKVSKEILAAYAARDVDAAKGAHTADAAAVPTRPANPALENLETRGSALDENQTSAEREPTENVENRGGARPGAGRPAGMTADRARMANLSDCPHPAVLAAVELLFDSWASGVGCPDVALTKDEAKDLALPWTNLLEYAGVAQKIPVWAKVGITCAWSTINTFKMKARIARDFAASRRREVPAASETAVS